MTQETRKNMKRFMLKIILGMTAYGFFLGLFLGVVQFFIVPAQASQEASLQPWEIAIASNICDSMTLDQIKNNSLSADEAKDYYNICMFSYNKTGLDVDEETVRYYIHQYLTLESDNSTRL